MPNVTVARAATIEWQDQRHFFATVAKFADRNRQYPNIKLDIITDSYKYTQLWYETCLIPV